MKKWIACLLALLLLAGFTGCAGEQPSAVQEELPANCLEILTKLWAAYPEEKPFSVLGGDTNHPVENAPGEFDLANDGAVYTLMIPEEALPKLDGAAAMIHFLMRNNFTCSAVHVASGSTGEDFAEIMKESLCNAVWDCGAPEKLFVAVIAKEYVVTCYGSGENLEQFAAIFKTVYPNAAVKFDDYLG